MSGAEVTDIIDEVDDFMDLMMNTGALGVNILRAISRTWSAYRVMQKDPDSRRIGEYSGDRDAQKDRLWKDVQFMMSHAVGGISFVATKETLG